MWRDLSDADRRDVKELAVAWVIGAICLLITVVVFSAGNCQWSWTDDMFTYQCHPVGSQDPGYEPPCRTVGHLEVPCE